MNIPIRRTISNIENRITGVFKNGWNGMYGPNMDKTTIQHMKNNANAGEKAMMDAAGRKMKSYKKGGMVHSTGPAMLHKGEMVVPKHAVEAMHKKWMLSDGGAVKYSDHSDAT